MGRKIEIRDVTFRDGHQSLWATRMSTEMMLPVARHLENAGIDSADIMAHAHLASAVRFTKDDPWERMDLLTELMPSVRRAGGAAAKTNWGFRLAPNDILELCTELTIRHGVNMLWVLNGLLDVDMIVDRLHLGKALGAETIAPLIYSISPVHTLELYEAKAREIVERADVDYIMIKDSGGLLTPLTVGPLVEAVRRGAGTAKVALHSHETIGLGAPVTMLGAQYGVDEIQCAVWPLAQGYSLPSMLTMVRNLRDAGFDVDVDEAEIEAASAHIVSVARDHGLPLGAPREYDHTHYRHQLPGGMASNLANQLAEAGLEDRLPQVLDEIPQVRADLGWPAMVTPFAQLLASQALLNVVTGERYARVPDEVVHYALGHYGALMAPIEPNVLDRIMALSTPESRLAPADMEPAIPALRAAYPHAREEELFLRYMVPEQAVEEMLVRQRSMAAHDSRASGGPLGGSTKAIVEIITKMAQLHDALDVTVESGDVRLRVSK